jgi:hypothetical protein
MQKPYHLPRSVQGAKVRSGKRGRKGLAHKGERRMTCRPPQARNQLLLTTHDPTLLDHELFRKDEVWLIDKNEKGQSELSGLGDHRHRNWSASLEARYRNQRSSRRPLIISCWARTGKRVDDALRGREAFLPPEVNAPSSENYAPTIRFELFSMKGEKNAVHDALKSVLYVPAKDRKTDRDAFKLRAHGLLIEG